MSIFDREELYVDNYYEYPGFRDSNDRHSSRNDSSNPDVYLVHSWTSVSRFVLTMLLRVGFFLVQIGSVPVTNVNLIMLQNIVDLACVTLVYVLAGFVVAYSGDLGGLIGEGRWIGHASTDKEEAIIGWQAIATASAICTSCLVGRTHTVGYLFIDVLLAGLLQPLLIHWAWNSRGWMARGLLDNHDVAFRDYGGSAIVHVVGSLTGLIGCMKLGRRILRLRDIDDASVPADSAGTAFAGYSLILLGLQSLCLPSTSDHHPRLAGKHMSLVVVNNLLAASSCSLLVVGLHFCLSREPFNHWTVMRCLQASIAGTTIVSAGVDVYSPILCVGLGCTGAIVFYLVSRKIFESALEDYCNVVAAHLSCAVVGTFVAPFCRNSTNGVYDAYAMSLNVAWQVICLVALVSLVGITMTMVFTLLECLGLLRNRSEFVNHLRAVVALERGPSSLLCTGLLILFSFYLRILRSYMQRLFFPSGETLYLQPGTAPVQHVGSVVGPRFIKYQRALAKLETRKHEEFAQTTQKSEQPEPKVAANYRQATEGRTLRKPEVEKSVRKIRKSEDDVGKSANTEANNLSAEPETNVASKPEMDVASNSEVETNGADSKLETRVKKSRQVHTIRLTSEAEIFKVSRNVRIIVGDNQVSFGDKKIIENTTKICSPANKSNVECSGDSSADFTKLEVNDSLMTRRFVVRNTENAEMAINREEKNIMKRRRETYRIHRTQKCTNLQLEAASEKDDSVEFLVEPRSRSFSSSSQADSEGSSKEEEEKEIHSKKYPGNLEFCESMSYKQEHFPIK